MELKLIFPKFIEDEYSYFDREKKCLNADKFNEVYGFHDPKCLRSDLPPVFFAGKVGERPFVLLSLNPGKSNKIEFEKYKQDGWKKTYLNFFEWFSQEKIGSPYYSRFAVFLSGLLGEDAPPPNREHRLHLLSQNLVNLDLIPYHSEGIRLDFESRKKERIELIKPYLSNLMELVKICKPQVFFINGAAFKPLLNEMGFDEKSEPIDVNSRLTAHIGEYNFTKTVWFDKFISSPSARVTNNELFDAGKEIRRCLRL